MTKNTARAITAAATAAIVMTARPIFPSLGTGNGVLPGFDGDRSVHQKKMTAPPCATRTLRSYFERSLLNQFGRFDSSEIRRSGACGHCVTIDTLYIAGTDLSAILPLVLAATGRFQVNLNESFDGNAAVAIAPGKVNRWYGNQAGVARRNIISGPSVARV
jgi:hypothetical protein